MSQLIRAIDRYITIFFLLSFSFHRNTITFLDAHSFSHKKKWNKIKWTIYHFRTFSFPLNTKSLYSSTLCCYEPSIIPFKQEKYRFLGKGYKASNKTVFKLNGNIDERHVYHVSRKSKLFVNKTINLLAWTILSQHVFKMKINMGNYVVNVLGAVIW